MNAMTARRLLMLCGLTLAAVPFVSAQTWIDDDFNTLDPLVWASRNTIAASPNPLPAPIGGILNTTQTLLTANQRAMAWSLASDFNFFTAPITMTAEFAGLGGVGGTGTVDRFMIISTAAGVGGHPSEALPGVWVSATNTGGVDYLEFGTRRSGPGMVTTRFAYSGVLTSMSLTLDDNNYSVSATGTGGFSVNGGSGFSGTFDTAFNEALFNNVYRFAFGAANRNAVTTGASAQWDSIVVIPEPGTLGLVAIAMGVLALSHRKRKRARQN